MNTSLLFLFYGSDMLVLPDGEAYSVPTAGEMDATGMAHGERHLVGELGGAPCYAADLPSTGLPEGMALLGLRALNGRISPAV